jgi:hypothetical protein
MTTLKQFLKPDWRKIIICILLTFLIGFISFVFGREYQDIFPELPLEQKPLTGVFLYKLNPLLWLPAPLVSKDYSYSEHLPLDSGEIYLVTIPYWIITSYLSSCLIIWIYDRFKSIKKKK